MVKSRAVGTITVRPAQPEDAAAIAGIYEPGHPHPHRDV
jgi:hypothetical protein